MEQKVDAMPLNTDWNAWEAIWWLKSTESLTGAEVGREPALCQTPR